MDHVPVSRNRPEQPAPEHPPFHLTTCQSETPTRPSERRRCTRAQLAPNQQALPPSPTRPPPTPHTRPPTDDCLVGAYGRCLRKGAHMGAAYSRSSPSRLTRRARLTLRAAAPSKPSLLWLGTHAAGAAWGSKWRRQACGALRHLQRCLQCRRTARSGGSFVAKTPASPWPRRCALRRRTMLERGAGPTRGCGAGAVAREGRCKSARSLPGNRGH